MKVAIAGYGIEGRASAQYWLSRGDDVVILDENPNLTVDLEDVSFVAGVEAFSSLDSYDLVVRTASLRPDRLAGAKKVWSATNEFFDECPAPIIGVTGTKGKGTTCSLIASILRAAGKTVHLVGNIGVPALEVLPNIEQDDIVVYELSSFQLWDLEKSPQIAVVLMIEPDHLDTHSSFEEYVSAKANIRRYQGLEGVCIYHPTNQYSRQIAMTGDWPEDDDERVQWQQGAHRYGVETEGMVYVDSNNFCVRNHPICSVNTLQIVGQHNIENACAAVSAARYLTVDDEAITAGLSDFTGLPHRLKFIAEKNGVKYYDDSIATTPGSAIAALCSFDEPKTIILGGSDKGASYTDIIAECKKREVQIVAVGQTGAAIYDLALEQGVSSYRIEGLMSEVVAKAAEVSAPGSVVLLSPASASFDQYASYAERGEQFIEAVQSLR